MKTLNIRSVNILATNKSAISPLLWYSYWFLVDHLVRIPCKDTLVDMVKFVIYKKLWHRYLNLKQKMRAGVWSEFIINMRFRSTENVQRREILLLYSITDLNTSFMILYYTRSLLHSSRSLIITVLFCIPTFHSASSKNDLIISLQNWKLSSFLSRAGLYWILGSSAFLYLLIYIVS